MDERVELYHESQVDRTVFISTQGIDSWALERITDVAGEMLFTDAVVLRGGLLVGVRADRVFW